MAISAVLFGIFSTLTFLYAFYTTFKFSSFLSNQHIDVKSSDAGSLKIMFTDLCLLLLFSLQHSFMASDWWKLCIFRCGLSVIERTLYILGTAAVLQFVMTYWQPVLCCGLWWIDTSDSFMLRLFFFLIHLLAWIIIFGAALTMDFAELFGIKQVFYYMQGLDPPILHKSYGTQKLFKHMRHPGSVCFMVVLWIHPIMTFSRLLCAVTLTLYLILGFRVNDKDYCYLKDQANRKTLELDS